MTKRDLKAYVRLDGTGRVVAGSLVLRKTKPKVGTWQEVQGYQCCNDTTLTFSLETVNFALLGLRILCNGTAIGTYNTSLSSTSIEEVVSDLNNVFGMLGVFAAADETTVSWVVTLNQKKALCPVGTLSFQIVELD